MTASLRCPLPQVRQTAAGELLGHSATVVAHLDTQVVADREPNRDRGGLCVPNGVAECFPDNRLGVIGQRAFDY